MDKDTAHLLAIAGQIVLALLRWWLRRKVMTVTTKQETLPAELLTLPQMAERVGVRDHHLRRLFERQLVEPALMLGGRRVIPLSRLTELKEAARKAGYLE